MSVLLQIEMPESCALCPASKIASKASAGWKWFCPFEENIFNEPRLREVTKECFDKRLENCPFKVEEVMHGEWLENGANYKCSRCGNTESYYTDSYCRVCGARMDGEKEE